MEEYIKPEAFVPVKPTYAGHSHSHIKYVADSDSDECSEAFNEEIA